MSKEQDIAQLALVLVVIGAFLWFGRGAFPGAGLVFGAAALAPTIYAHRRTGETLREIGFRFDNFLPTLRLLALPAFIAVTLTWLTASALGGADRPVFRLDAGHAGQFLFFAVLQQYLLLGFFYRRLATLTSVRWAALSTAAVFAILHLPNLFLTSATFVAGLVACSVYRRSPNLFANGLVHAALSSMLYYSLPRWLTGGLRVGADYLGWIGA